MSNIFVAEEQFRELCFDFGVELDDITSEKEQVRKEQGESAAEGLSDDVVFKIDIPANRYDLLCLEGLTRAFRIFMGVDTELPNYRVVIPDNPETIVVKPETGTIRPFCVSAVLRGVQFDETRYNSFIKLQEKLHQNICRERTLVAIGTHDLDTVSGSFTYEARAPRDISFIPLKETREFNAEELMHYYDVEKVQSPLKKYLPIIRDSPVYPVIYDSNRVVLSMPPIINGEHSKIHVNTKNVLIECTATDRTKANVVLNTIVCMFSGYCTAPFEVEGVRIVYEDSAKEEYTPGLATREVHASLKKLIQGIGLENLDGDLALQLLQKMQLVAKFEDDLKDRIVVTVGPTRSDILHACDVEEDLAIAFGYNNIPYTMPKASTIGREQPLNKLSDLIREGCAQAGFIEVLNWALISRKDNFHNMRLPVSDCVVLGGIRSNAEFEVVRTNLTPYLLKTLGHNRGKMSLPIKIFEVSDVCLLDDTEETGARNERRVGAVFCGKTSSFEIAHGLLDRIMTLLNIPFPHGYHLREHPDHPSLFPGMRGEIVFKDQVVGFLGVVHPEVLSNFSIDAPCSVLEFNLEPFL